jgi:small-conductance mechanosensitive channel
MLIGSAALTSASSALTLVVGFAAIAVAVTLFLGRRAESNRQLQDSTIATYQAADQLKSQQIAALQEKVKVQEAQITHLTQEISDLTERVLQVAKVDALRAEVTHHFATVDSSFATVLRKLDGLHISEPSRRPAARRPQPPDMSSGGD